MSEVMSVYPLDQYQNAIPAIPRAMPLHKLNKVQLQDRFMAQDSILILYYILRWKQIKLNWIEYWSSENTLHVRFIAEWWHGVSMETLQLTDQR